MMKILVLGLGNDLIADDAVGIIAARELSKSLPDGVEVQESSVTGVALLERFTGFEKAIVIDAIISPENPPGEILELDPSRFTRVLAPSPHYSGFGELFLLAGEMDLDFPEEVKIFAMSVTDILTIGGEMTQKVKAAVPALVGKVEDQVREWLGLPD